MRATGNFVVRKPNESRKGSIIDKHDPHDMRTTFGEFAGNNKFRNTKSILYIILAFLAMGYTGVTFIFSILAYSETTGRTWHISQLVDNWKQTPIVTIMVTEEQNCANGFEPIVAGIWPGTFRGCSCEPDVKEEKIRDTLVIGRCDTIQRNNGCQEVDRRNPIFIRRFYPNKLICVQRQGRSIINTRRLYQFSDNNCPADFKKCGPNDNPEFQTCISVDLDCPIISLIVDVRGKSDPGEKYDGFQEVPLSETNSIYYSSTDKDGSMPISEFVLSEGEGEEQRVCVNLEDSNLPKGRIVYDLLNTNFYRGCVSNVDGLQYDNRWDYVTQVSELDIFNTNRLFFDMVHDLPGWPEESKMEANKYNLFLRKYIEWGEACEGEESTKMQNLAENLNPINTLANAQLFYMVICFLSLLVMGICTPIFIILRHCMILRGEKRVTYQDVIISTGMRFVSFIFIVLKASFLISCLVLIGKYHSIYEHAKFHDCSDPTTLFILGYVDEHLEYARRHNWVSLSAVIVIAICELLSICILYILKRVAERNHRDTRRSLLESLNGSRQKDSM